MFCIQWRDPSRIATGTKHANAGRLQWVLPKMAKSLGSLYASPKWLLRRWRWKLQLKVSIHVITNKFSEIMGSPLHCSFRHGKSNQTAHFPYHNALFYKSSCVLKHHPTCKASRWTQFQHFVICWKDWEGNSICLGYFNFYFFHFSIYFPTNVLCGIIYKYLTHTKTPTCLGTQGPSSGIYYNTGAWANLLIYLLFMVIS